MDDSKSNTVGLCEICEQRHAQGVITFRGHRLNTCSVCAGAIEIGGWAAQFIKAGLEKMRERRAKRRAVSATHEHAYKVQGDKLVCDCGQTFQGAP